MHKQKETHIPFDWTLITKHCWTIAKILSPYIWKQSEGFCKSEALTAQYADPVSRSLYKVWLVHINFKTSSNGERAYKFFEQLRGSLGVLICSVSLLSNNILIEGMVQCSFSKHRSHSAWAILVHQFHQINPPICGHRLWQYLFKYLEVRVAICPELINK